MSKPIVLVGEAKGENEVRINSSFVGASGIELLKMLDEASIIGLTEKDYDNLNAYYNGTSDPHLIDRIWRAHVEVYRTNVFQLHPPGNRLEHLCGPKSEGIRGYSALVKAKYVRREYIPELERLGDEIDAINPNLIIALGNTPLWALTSKTGISKLRGTTFLSTHVVAGYKLLPTYHPAAVLRQWELRPTVIIDLMKAKRESEYADIRRPRRSIWIEPTIQDIKNFFRKYIDGCENLSVDIETSGNRITCIGFAPSKEIALVIPFDDARRKGRSYWINQEDEVASWRLIRDILEDKRIKKTFQNGLYDIAFLLRSMNIRVRGATHDTMLLQHAQQPEALKGLGYLGSIYTDEGPWKSERKHSTTIKSDE